MDLCMRVLIWPLEIGMKAFEKKYLNEDLWARRQNNYQNLV